MGAIAQVGHICLDTVVTRQGTRSQLGGPPTYASLITHLLGDSLDARSCVGGDFPEEEAETLRRRGVDASRFTDPGSATTRFTLDYTGPERRMTVPTICSSINEDDLKGLPRAVMVTPIIGEVTQGALASIDAGVLALDPQGLTRCRGDDGSITLKHWWDPGLLRRLTVLKASLGELRLITGEEDPWRGLARLEEAGVEVSVATLGAEGALMLHGGRRIRIPAYPRTRLIDATGAGDCFLACMVSALAAGDTSDWAAALGSAAASCVVETWGPELQATRGMLEERAAEIHDATLADLK